MRRAVRRWCLLAGSWAAVSLFCAALWADFLHRFEICVPEWGGCAEEPPPYDREFALDLVETFVWLWVPVAAAIALFMVFVSLLSAVAADFRAGRQRRLERASSNR